MSADPIRLHPTLVGTCCLTTPFSLPLHQRLPIGWIELLLCGWLAGVARYDFICSRLLRPWRNQAYPIGAGAVAGFQKHNDEFPRWVILGHHAPGVLITLFFNLLLGEVDERVASARYRLARGINNHSSPPGVLERGCSSRPEHIEVFPDPAKICLAFSMCPVWYVTVFACHRGKGSSGSSKWLQLETYGCASRQ